MRCPHCHRCFLIDVEDPSDPAHKPKLETALAAADALDNLLQETKLGWGTNLIEIADALRMSVYERKPIPPLLTIVRGETQ